MKISKSELIEMDACELGLKRFIEQTNNTEDSVEVTSLVGGLNTHEDLLWLASKKIPKRRIVRFAYDCALIVAHHIKPHTDNYDLIVDFLNNASSDDIADDFDDINKDIRDELWEKSFSFIEKARYSRASCANTAVSFAFAAYSAKYSGSAKIHAINVARSAQHVCGSSCIDDLLREMFNEF